MTIPAGKIQDFKIVEIKEKTFVLSNDHGSIEVRKRDISSEEKPFEGMVIKAFSYYDEEAELRITTQLPEIEVGGTGVFRIKNTNSLGAFIDIGSSRDILLPYRETKEDLKTGDRVFITLQDDTINRRLYATQRITDFFENKDLTYERGDEVSLTIAETVDVGRRVIVNGKHTGILFKQEMNRNVHTGEKLRGFIRKVEGKNITVSLQREGMALLEDAQKRILEYLTLNNGFAPLHDDTDPEEIKVRLHLSKKAFKKAAGMLMKDGKITIEPRGIKLVKGNEIDGLKPTAKDLKPDFKEKKVMKKLAEKPKRPRIKKSR